ncbi:sigma factor-like helix-turn-helix DNA-binding protein [Streptomyces sp. CB01635]|uniref:sigma factor-like helix-turn-helix DNA-binding protein n=1 Tax=Streptomyces sp. CB01635 TaxID=2020326 RepID=UPI0026BDDC5B
MEQLPERERSILHMRFFEDMTQSRIAEKFGISHMHVSRRIHNSCIRVREEAGCGRDRDEVIGRRELSGVPTADPAVIVVGNGGAGQEQSHSVPPHISSGLATGLTSSLVSPGRSSRLPAGKAGAETGTEAAAPRWSMSKDLEQLPASLSHSRSACPGATRSSSLQRTASAAKIGSPGTS